MLREHVLSFKGYRFVLNFLLLQDVPRWWPCVLDWKWLVSLVGLTLKKNSFRGYNGRTLILRTPPFGVCGRARKYVAVVRLQAQLCQRV